MVEVVGTRAVATGSKRALWGRGPKGAWGRAPECAAVLFAALTIAFGGGCTDGAADQVTRPVALGMTNHMTPYYDDGQLTIYQVEVPVPLPVRKMTADDARSVGPPPKDTPYPRGVFLRAEDENVELHFTLSNVDDQAHDVWLLIDPWNEFVRWRPGVTLVNDELSQPNYGYDMEFSLAGKQRVEGTITADDMHEIAIKLASVEKLLASPQVQAASAAGTGFSASQLANNIFNPLNRSNSVPRDLLYTPWIPPVVAGVTGFDLGLRTTEKANVAVEITIDVQDLRGDRFVAQDSTDRQMGVPPRVLSPPGAK